MNANKKFILFVFAILLPVAAALYATDSITGHVQTIAIDSTTNTVKIDATTNSVRTTPMSSATTVSSSSITVAGPVTQLTGRRYLEIRVASSTAANGTNEVWVNVGGSVGTVSSGLLVTPANPLKLELGTVAVCFISSTTVPIAYTQTTY